MLILLVAWFAMFVSGYDFTVKWTLVPERKSKLRISIVRAAMIVIMMIMMNDT